MADGLRQMLYYQVSAILVGVRCYPYFVCLTASSRCCGVILSMAYIVLSFGMYVTTTVKEAREVVETSLKTVIPGTAQPHQVAHVRWVLRKRKDPRFLKLLNSKDKTFVDCIFEMMKIYIGKENYLRLLDEPPQNTLASNLRCIGYTVGFTIWGFLITFVLFLLFVSVPLGVIGLLYWQGKLIDYVINLVWYFRGRDIRLLKELALDRWRDLREAGNLAVWTKDIHLVCLSMITQLWLQTYQLGVTNISVGGSHNISLGSQTYQLGSQTHQFAVTNISVGVTNSSVWGHKHNSLGSQTYQFGVTNMSVWGHKHINWVTNISVGVTNIAVRVTNTSVGGHKHISLGSHNISLGSQIYQLGSQTHQFAVTNISVGVTQYQFGVTNISVWGHKHISLGSQTYQFGVTNIPVGVTNIAVRKVYEISHYFFLFLNVAVGLMSCAKRVLLSALFGALSISRLDRSTLSRDHEKSDSGYITFISMLVVDNAHNNPTMRVFAHLLWTKVLTERHSTSDQKKRRVNTLNSNMYINMQDMRPIAGTPQACIESAEPELASSERYPSLHRVSKTRACIESAKPELASIQQNPSLHRVSDTRACTESAKPELASSQRYPSLHRVSKTRACIESAIPELASSQRYPSLHRVSRTQLASSQQNPSLHRVSDTRACIESAEPSLHRVSDTRACIESAIPELASSQQNPSLHRVSKIRACIESAEPELASSQQNPSLHRVSDTRACIESAIPELALSQQNQSLHRVSKTRACIESAEPELASSQRYPSLHRVSRTRACIEVRTCS
ncbi:hypothetical protein Btru_027806 [Bulinus truncatus]|nr:hypothetical protein Btru_027806 [Bulinus truncatus]